MIGNMMILREVGMSVEGFKSLFGGSQETVLELVQLEDGALALRTMGSQQPLVKIEFNDEVRTLLGEQIGLVAQHMIQAAIFGVMEQQMGKWHAQVVDQKPQFYS